ncbi:MULTISPECIES: hypothetical protein [Spirulina sp. CCY15215]|uniref:hypothetical protein n=1 Tax=Spirulina sp. CCY15215 TaxID=2767591 RepID=UPI00194FF0C7|nr:hypothetical protein [Spirulina major]
MPASDRGADLTALPRQASIDLAPLVTLLAKAIADDNNSPDAKNPKNRSLFSYNAGKKRLRICTSGVLLRLFTLLNREHTFKLEPGREFIQNFNPPRYKFRSRLGGQLTEGNKEKLPRAIANLKQAITEELEAALPDEVSLTDLVCQDANQELKRIASKVKTSLNAVSGESNLSALLFEEDLPDQKQKAKKVAKLISARETIEAGDYFLKMCAAIEDYTKNQLGWDEDEIEDAIASLEAEYRSSDSEINSFLNFLNDEAMSRVRAQVSRQIMDAIGQAIANNSTINEKLLGEYISRINYFIELVNENGFSLDLTAIYGDKADINFLKYVNNSSFFWSLAVWPEWNAQIFEEETLNSEIVRDVTYRFRINGQNPEFKKPAFEAHLDNIEQHLCSDEKDRAFMSPLRINRCLVELIFLTVIVPSDFKTPLNKEDILQEMKTIKKRIEENDNIIKSSIDKLRKEGSGSMKQISTALIDVIRNKGNKIISRVRKTTSQQYICVKRGILNLDRLRGAEIGSKDLLQKEKEWFQEIEVDTSPNVPNLLFSIKVNIELSERNLAAKEEKTTIKLQRQLSSKLLQILWIPYKYEKTATEKDPNKKYQPSQSVKQETGWTASSTIQIEYETRTLKRNENHSNNQKNEEAKQIHAVAVTAFPILIYCCLWSIIKQIKERDRDDDSALTALMLRFQDSRETDDRSGEGYVYAAAQAIEAILARELPVRMQGMVLENSQGNNSSYVRKGTFNALLSAFPLVISTPEKPAVPKIGLISYIARPCDESPHETKKNHLFLSQSYVANAVDKPFIGYELKAERMQSDIVSDEKLKNQRLVGEEVAYLQKQGCEHIILLSHSYKSRRINKVVEDNTPLITKEFLQELFQTFPDLTLYTLLRDVFPATRLHKREDKEAAFEILRASDHGDFSKTFAESHQRDIIPIYTFATLHAIEPKHEQRPQSGFCIYFLVSDRSTGNINQTERSRQHLINPEGNSTIHPCLLSVLRGLHFIEAEKGIQKQQYLPVLDPFGWISPNTVEAAGEVHIMHSRRKGKVLLSYRAILTHVSSVLNIGG